MATQKSHVAQKSGIGEDSFPAFLLTSLDEATFLKVTLAPCLSLHHPTTPQNAVLNLGVVAWAHNASIQETEAGDLQTLGQSGLYSKILP